MSFINSVITRIVRHEFSRSMHFDEGGVPHVPRAATAKPRLLYMHVPFCERLCPYCSFNRIVFERTLGSEYFAALKKELGLYKGKGYDFSGIYVGGGTPTVMVDELAEVLGLAKELFSIREISVETNPNHLTDYNLKVLKQVGVNRLSVGVQSFDDGLLKKMERYEKYGSGEEIAHRLTEIKGCFDTLNADMIFNFPTQTMATLNSDLDVLERIGVDQITYYPLMVSDSTRRLVTQTLGRVDYGEEERFYSQILKRLLPGYRFSSAWCFSKKAEMIDEYIVDYDEYAGLGSGSIGFLSGTCYANTFDIPEYIRQVAAGALPLMASRTFPMKDMMRYDFLMKLFGTRLDLSALREKFGASPWTYLWFDILAFRLSGRVTYREPMLHLTRRGCYAWVIMMREFFIAVNNFRDYCRTTAR
ncbi:MAG: coproporphyrinogen III oxidase family protein [Syntrophales bacterium]|nr:coproporphyrinogen III oxidase family protein [Syntrophales bacterium]